LAKIRSFKYFLNEDRKESIAGSWRKTTGHGSRRTTHGGKRQVVGHLSQLLNPVQKPIHKT
jgi:hypothetical protein